MPSYVPDYNQEGYQIDENRERGLPCLDFWYIFNIEPNK